MLGYGCLYSCQSTLAAQPGRHSSGASIALGYVRQYRLPEERELAKGYLQATMSVSETPEDPFVLDIVSVTFGPADCTDYTRRKFNDAWAQDPGIKIWSFQGGLAFFPSDPMPTFIKATVTVYRNTIPHPDGSVSWSNFKSVVVDETKPTVVITFDGVNDTAWISPPLSDYGQYIVWAYWHTTDVTKGVQHQYASLESPANNGVNIAVDQDSLS